MTNIETAYKIIKKMGANTSALTMGRDMIPFLSSSYTKNKNVELVEFIDGEYEVRELTGRSEFVEGFKNAKNYKSFKSAFQDYATRALA